MTHKVYVITAVAGGSRQRQNVTDYFSTKARARKSLEKIKFEQKHGFSLVKNPRILKVDTK